MIAGLSLGLLTCGLLFFAHDLWMAAGSDELRPPGRWLALVLMMIAGASALMTLVGAASAAYAAWRGWDVGGRG